MKGSRGRTCTFVALVCIGLLPGCSSENETASALPGGVAKRIMALQNEASIATVKREVGEPASEFGDAESELTFNYPRWQIYFNNGRMVRRIHEVRRIHPGRVPNGDPPAAQVLSLHRGMSPTQLVQRLGRPDVVEVEYEANEPPERILRYGAWELHFRNGALQMRTHQ